MQKKHKIGVLTAGVLALAIGTAAHEGFIPHWEGIDLVAVHNRFDPKGVTTVCYGRTNFDDPNLKDGDVYTAVMCGELLKQDLPKYNAQLASCLPADFQVTDHQHVALLSFVYNRCAASLSPATARPVAAIWATSPARTGSSYAA